MNSINQSAQHVRPALQSTRLLAQLRERLRHLHYSIRTEDVYLYWVRAITRWWGLCR